MATPPRGAVRRLRPFVRVPFENILRDRLRDNRRLFMVGMPCSCFVIQDFQSKTPNCEFPCGRCLGCRLEKSKEWALRCVHEAQMNENNNCFITLTYNDKNLPHGNTLIKLHYQKFIRALRKKTKKRIRYYMCGEYGTSGKRKINPHYHAILFGHQFSDAYFWNMRQGNRVYRSETLESIWTYGHL